MDPRSRDRTPSSFFDINMGRWARRAERCCCTFATYLPLSFVYGLTTWAVWVDVNIGSSQVGKPTWLGASSLSLLPSLSCLH